MAGFDVDVEVVMDKSSEGIDELAQKWYRYQDGWYRINYSRIQDGTYVAIFYRYVTGKLMVVPLK